METTEKRPRSVLRDKNFLMLFQGSLTSAIAATLYSFAISFYILDITGNNASVQGVYLFVCGLAFVLASFAGGVLADRWNKVKIVYGSDFIKGGLILVSFVLLRVFISRGMTDAQLTVLFVIGIVSNVLAAVFTPASSALIPELVAKEQLMQANSLFSILNNLVSMLGLVLAAVFYSMLPITALFAIIGVLYVLSGVTEVFIRVAHVRKDEALTLKVVLRDFGEGLRYLWRMRPVLCLVISGVFLNFFVVPFSSNLLPYVIKTDIAGSDYMLREYLTPESWAAVFSLLLGVGSIAMSVIMGSQKAQGAIGGKIKRWLAVMAGLMLLIALGYSLTARRSIDLFLVITSVGMLLIGVAVVGINLPIHVAIQGSVQKGMLAKVNSIMTIGSQGLIPFSSLIAGILLTSRGAGALFFFCAGGLALTTVFVCLSRSISEL